MAHPVLFCVWRVIESPVVLLRVCLGGVVVEELQEMVDDLCCNPPDDNILIGVEEFMDIRGSLLEILVPVGFDEVADRDGKGS